MAVRFSRARPANLAPRRASPALARDRGASSPRTIGGSERAGGFASLRDGIFGAPWIVASLGSVALVAMIVSQVLGSSVLVIFVAIAFVLLALRLEEVLQAVVRFAPLFILPAFALLSTLWSDAPSLTTRAAIELLMTFFVAFVVGTQCSPRTGMIAILFGVAVLAILSLPDVPQAYRTHHWMRGAFASKNACAYNAQFLFIFALALVLDGRVFWPMRLLALLLVPIALVEVKLAQSGGALVGTIMAGLMLPALLVFGRLPRGLRITVAATMFVVIAGFVVFNDEALALIDTLRGKLGKDQTYTGRTFLWDTAARVGAQSPWLGQGYHSFWRLGNLEAEALWRHFGILDRTGFNFHNSFIEFYVDAGLIGLAGLIAFCAVCGLIGLIRQVRTPSNAVAVFLTVQAVLYVRSLGETTLLLPFGTATAVWVLACVYCIRRDEVGGGPAEPLRLTPPRGARPDASRLRRA